MVEEGSYSRVSRVGWSTWRGALEMEKALFSSHPSKGSLVAQMVKNLPAMQEIWI